MAVETILLEKCLISNEDMGVDMQDALQFVNVCQNNVVQLSRGISDLYFVRHKQRYDHTYWQWRYLDGPGGPSDLVVALRKDKVVGLYGVLYVPMLLQGRQTLAGLMGSMAIDPAERSWQCYRGLVDRSMSNSQQKELVFRFGVVPLRMMQLTRRMGTKHMGLMSICFGLLDADRFLQARRIPYPLSLLGYVVQPFLGVRHNVSTTSGLEIQEVQCFGDQFDQFWSQTALGNYSGYLKDAAYLNWRYVKCPLRKYYKLAAYKNNKLEGFIVFCSTGVRNSACVLEIMSNRNDLQTMRVLLSAACKQLHADKIGSMIASFMPNAAALVVARSLGFRPWSRLLSNSQMIVAVNKIEDACSERDFLKCTFSLGDWVEL